MPRSALIEELMQDLSLTAASIIVTVYGDVVVPRGEILWMGSLIGLCDRMGISENLVRTATSRLVASGRLEGNRAGRRSFYRLAPAARREFTQAARLLYATMPEAEGWLVIAGAVVPEGTARHFRLARMGGDVWLAPDHGQAADLRDLPELTGAAVLQATRPPLGEGALAGFWDLEQIALGYHQVLERFRPLAERLRAGEPIAPVEAMTARLLLVQIYRTVLLRDPRLPAAALPADWPGAAARQLFSDLYRALSPMAEAAVGALLEGEDGPLPAVTPQSTARLLALGQALA